MAWIIPVLVFPVFGVLFSCLLLGEKVTPQMGVGFAVIFAALLFSELAPKKDA